MKRVLTALAVLTVSPVVVAQVRASESALVAQTIDGTRFTVEYSRPRARSRDSLFGKIVTRPSSSRWKTAAPPGSRSGARTVN
jgi:hypothetical protein